MEASRLTISGETLKAHSATLSKERKKELRREAIIAYINTKPAGEIIKVSTLQAVAGLNHNGMASVFLDRMVNDGLIGRQHAEGSRRYYTWWVKERGKDFTATPDTEPAEELQLELETEAKEVIEVPEEKPVEKTVAYDPQMQSKIGHNFDLRLAAKDFAWQQNSDSLRDFIAWYIR